MSSPIVEVLPILLQQFRKAYVDGRLVEDEFDLRREKFFEYQGVSMEEGSRICALVEAEVSS